MSLAPSCSSRRILCVGLTCVDIISVVNSYPAEDSDNRCLRQTWSRGGNASNNASVLAILGNLGVACLSCLSKKDVLRQFVVEDFVRFEIDSSFQAFYSSDDEEWQRKFPINAKTTYSGVPVKDGERAVNLDAGIPLSTCVLSQDTGSRTICHHNAGAPEVDPVTFYATLAQAEFGWIHFEGRVNAAEIEDMIAHVRGREKRGLVQSPVVVSVELEKCRVELDSLINKGDVTFISKQRARMKGFHSAEEAVKGFLPQVAPNSVVIVPWGDRGAAGGIAPPRNKSAVDGPLQEVTFVEAHHPEKVVDTLGAGDTFIAAVIHRMNQILTEKSTRIGKPEGGASSASDEAAAVAASAAASLWTQDELTEALRFGCWLAGEKCARFGFGELKTWYASQSI